MFTICRYRIAEGRSTREEYDTFACSSSQAEDMVRVLRGMRDGHWYWAENAVQPATPANSDETAEMAIQTAISGLLAS